MNQKLSIPTTELLADLREMCRQWRAQGNRLDIPGRLPSSPGAANVAPICQAIEVTSSTADAYGYPARIQTYDGSTWADTYAEVRAVQIGSTIAGAVLATGFYPIGRLMYVSPTGLHVYGLMGAGVGTSEHKGLTFTSHTGATSGDPANGRFLWNNATQSSATALHFDNQDAGAISATTLWTSLEGTSSGLIWLQQADDSSKRQIWKWSAVTDGTGYRIFAVTLQYSSASIDDAKAVYCLFMGAHGFTAEEVDGTPSTVKKLKLQNTSTVDNGDGTITLEKLLRVSSNDTTTGYLNGKLTATDGTITLTEVNDGGNETLNVSRPTIGGTIVIDAGSNNGRASPSGASNGVAALDTVRQPSTTNDTLVIASVELTVEFHDTTNQEVLIEFLTDASNPPTTVLGEWRLHVSAVPELAPGPDVRTSAPGTFIVKKDHYYKLKTTAVSGATGGVSLQYCKEHAL